MDGRQVRRWAGWGLVGMVVAGLWLAPLVVGAARPDEISGLEPMAVFQVDSTGDEVDANVADGLCQTAGGQCTLRAAIQQSIQDGGGTVAFTALVGTPTIQVGATGNGVLPALSVPITIDGTTAGGGLVELDGSLSGSGSGLTLTGAGSVVKGLAINRFFGSGVVVRSNNNLIEGNRIGTNAEGTEDLGNSAVGVLVNGLSVVVANNTIRNNLISGNGSHGIYFYGANASANVVEGNYIGIDVTGHLYLRNDGSGIEVWNAANNRIGGMTGDQRNVISGNSISGVVLNGATDTIVQGNYIGTNVDGTEMQPNVGTGIYVGGSGNMIGGPAASKAAGSCNPPCNLVSGNSDGIFIDGNDNVVQGNFVGTDLFGGVDLGNSSYGIVVGGIGGVQNTIGGLSTSEGNVVAFNRCGVRVVQSGSVDNAIQGNSIWANEELGIDLGGDGVTANDPGDPDTGPNQLQNYPVLNGVITGPPSPWSVISGTLDSTASTLFRLEFYYSENPGLTGDVEGQHFLTSADVTTDSGGWATFNITVPTTIPAAYFVTATATDPAGNTSEFSEGRIVVAETMMVIDPWLGGRLVYTDTSALTTTVDVPPGAVTQTLMLALQPMAAPTEPPLAGLRSGNETFDLTAYLENVELPGFAFVKPLTITLRYTDADVFGIVESELVLYYWDGSTWQDAADTCSPSSTYVRDMVANVLQVAVCHLTEWNIQGPEMYIWQVYLPLAVRGP